MTQKQKILGASLAALLLIVGAAAYAYFHTTALAPVTDIPSQNGGGDQSPVITGIEGLPEGANAEVVGSVDSKAYESTPKPSTDRPLPQNSVSADVYAIMEQKRAGLVAEIQKNPAVMTNWLALGTVYKQTGDYEGARIYYKYVTTVNSTNLAAHWDLGAVSENYLHDYATAESEFRTVIALDKTYVSAYTELYAMFVATGDTAKAQEILTQGLAVNPGALDLLVLQAKAYAAQGDTAKARAAYDAAIAQAQKEQNDSLAASLQAEERDLR